METIKLAVVTYVVVLMLVTLWAIMLHVTARGPTRTTVTVCGWLAAVWLVTAPLLFATIPVVIGKWIVAGPAIVIAVIFLRLRWLAQRYLADN